MGNSLCAGGGNSTDFIHSYDDIISLDNLLSAWTEFLRGKRSRADVQVFQMNLMDNIFCLHHDLQNKTYVHGGYAAFNISDPKPRHIHKASVRDRLLHHAVYRQLYPQHNQTFIAHSYSCRKNKGTHKALDAFTAMSRKVSKNNTKTAWVLKCDIKKFFTSIDHERLHKILQKKIGDSDTLWLLGQVITSFETAPDKGLPLGNLTSQLLVNIYMNEFDQWMKHTQKVKYDIRYADDFGVLSQDKQYLLDVLQKLKQFLQEKLLLQLHPDKVSISTVASGVDFLGWVHFSHHRILRTVTKRRMLQNIAGLELDSPTVQSCVGMLQHGDAYKLQRQINTCFL
jgi:retron-type reverse transcriptase